MKKPQYYIKKILTEKGAKFFLLRKLGLTRFLSDKTYLEKAFYAHMGRPLNLDNPVTYNEKLQWMKLYDRNPRYTDMVDKAEAKKIAEEIVGKEFIVPTIGVWESFDEIPFDSLPNSFVIKCTHDSGGLVICKDKALFNKAKAKKKIEKCLKKNYYINAREWPYKNVAPRILVEEYMEDAITGELRDYKFFCFGGVPKAMFIASERFTEGVETCFDFFDMNYGHLEMRHGHPNAIEEPKKPEKFEQMKRLAELLSAGLPQVRIDLYEVNGKVYFGEFTFFHHSGLVPFEPEEWDKLWGDWIVLPEAMSED